MVDLRDRRTYSVTDGCETVVHLTCHVGSPYLIVLSNSGYYMCDLERNRGVACQKAADVSCEQLSHIVKFPGLAIKRSFRRC